MTSPRPTSPPDADRSWLSAAADGETGRARALLKECVRRAPDDIEVQLALTSMED